jgi:hypothetical protein
MDNWKKTLRVFVLFIAFSSSVHAQNIRLSGTIIDIETRQPVP